MTNVLPQFVKVVSVELIVNEPPVSAAVATPVKFVVVTAGYSSVTFVGQLITGAVVSRMVMVWVQLEWLLH